MISQSDEHPSGCLFCAPNAWPCAAAPQSVGIIALFPLAHPSSEYAHPNIVPKLPLKWQVVICASGPYGRRKRAGPLDDIGETFLVTVCKSAAL